jgi:hypothetical protein
MVVVDDFDARIGSLKLYNRFGQEINFGTAAKLQTAVDLFWPFAAVVAALTMLIYCIATVKRWCAEIAKMESIIHAEMDAVQKPVAKPSYIYIENFNEEYGDKSDSESETIDFEGVMA